LYYLNAENIHPMKIQFTLVFLLLVFPLTALAQMGAGNAITTNGSTSYAVVPNSTTLNSTNALSIEAWVKPTVFANNLWENVIVSKDDWSSGSNGYALRCGDNGILSFNIGTSSGWFEAVSPQGAMVLNQWQHVAGTFDGTVIKAYVNGIEVGTANFSGSIVPSTFDMTIGRNSYFAGGGRFFNGDVDEVRLWNTGLSQATIRDYMCQSLNAAHPNNANLMAHYTFDAATTTFLDNSPNSNNGSIVGATVQASGAALGNASAHSYGTPVGTMLAAPSGEMLTASNVTGATAMHLYRVDGAPNPLNLPAGFTQIDTAKYWGVYYVGGTAPTSDLTYAYGSGTFFNANNECEARVAERPNFSQATWTGLASNNDPGNDQISFMAARGEFVFGLSSGVFASIANSTPAICPGDTAALSIPMGTGVTYQWYLNGSPIANATSNEYMATQAGDYHLEIASSQCNFTTDTIGVSVYAAPSISFTLDTSMACILGGSQNLMATPAGGTFSGPGVTGTVLDPLFAGLGTHDIIYTYMDSNACSYSQTDQITVLPNPTVSFPGPMDYCENESAFVLNAGTPVGGQYSGLGVSAGIFDPGVAGVGSHVISYTFVDMNGCSAEDSSTYNVLAVPATPIVTQIGSDLISSSATGNQWYNGSQAIPGATSATFTPMGGGTFYVVVTGTNGCVSDTSNQLVLVNLEDAMKLEFSLFPNPSHGATKLVWENDAQSDFTLELIAVDGKSVFKQNYQAQGTRSTVELNFSELNQGLYFMKLSSESGTAIQKLTIQ